MRVAAGVMLVVVMMIVVEVIAAALLPGREMVLAARMIFLVIEREMAAAIEMVARWW